MSDVTIKQLAKVLDLPVDKLLAQLGEAGMEFSDPDQVISNTEKMKLHGFLRRKHGKGGSGESEAASAGPKQVTLRRRKVSELKVASGSGRAGARGGAKTVNVEVRSKRTYVKRSAISEDASADVEREEAARKLQESQEQRQREETERAEQQKQRREEAERKLQQEEDARRQAEEAAAAAQAEAEANEQAKAQAEAEAQAKAEAESSSVPETIEEPVDTSETTVEAESESVSVKDTKDSEASKEKKDAWSMPVMPRVHDQPKRRERVREVSREEAMGRPKPTAKAAAPEKKAKDEREERTTGGKGGKGGKKFGSGKLHLSDADRARRSSGRRRGRGSERPSAGGSGPHGFSKPTAPVVREVAVGEANVVSELAQKMAVKGSEVVKALFNMGMMATINQVIDHDTAVLVVEELGHKPVQEEDKGAEAALLEHAATSEEQGEKLPRPPVVTIMGHVDHGKTSLLDYIRRAKVATGEAGGITQHIGAYHVTTDKGVITFLDTPGHAAFTSMRARGAQSTDIVVLVVAADDGVKPQTVEAIKHARAANVPLIVAVNKIDKSDANPDNVKQGLVAEEVVPEDWGGDVQFVPVSAKTGQGIDDLLDSISLQAELMELTAVHDGPASGVVIESRLDRGRGPMATMLVQRGTLKKSDYAVCGVEYGRMRALIDENGKSVAEAGPSIPVQVLGLSGVPEAGDDFVVVADERLAKEVAQEREQRRRETRLVSKSNRLEDIMAQMGQSEEQQQLNILIKADVQGSAEALRESLTQIGNELVKVNVVSSGVGGITESDATLAAASKALVIGFNVRADASARKVIDTAGLDVRYFSIIYDVIDQVTQAATGLLGNEIREEIIGTAEVRDVFRSSKFGAVAGCMVSEGTVKRSKPIRVLRDNTVIFEGELESLRRFKENVEEVKSGTECGIGVKQYNDVKPGDQIECFERIEVARTL
ncbi:MULTISPECIES: translation initiation factor IF-2 [Oleiagrimonas]|uniref:Translation initiation factor IF-2 n=1 Tax=Oleiagrimonas citrea TaxID=1665687 RepID=A0A846ZF14_9GAMM|nr:MULTISPECIES: translation initiation factor IF-2 [Oleiagrimonas]NKZ37476.1 translation initiation factor IF-2 [Oleiagrimonas citrea]RAP57976.1 translation initiation factor IF-2 [Oleiagrimonas sp. MCCC 1A03011]